MILEAVYLNVMKGEETEFEKSFFVAQDIISSIPGYISHELHKCIEKENVYLFLVQWEDLESHTVNFRESPKYQEWKTLLHHYYDPFPEVNHYDLVLKSGV